MLKFLIIFHLCIGIIFIMAGFQEFSKRGFNVFMKILGTLTVILFWPLILIYLAIKNIYFHISK
jgi:hypothetical protein